MNYPFVKCLNPIKIQNPHTKEPLLVGCGKCEACRLQKSSMRSLKCKLESLSHKYTYFVTLTYSNEYVPLMKPVTSSVPSRITGKRLMQFVPACERIWSDMDSDVCECLTKCIEIDESSSVCEEIDYYGDAILAEVDMTLADYDILCKKCELGDSIPFLYKRDIQLFIKRLRKYLSSISNEKIRYYAVGEYGPVHFRPHYHLMLWFSDEQIAEKIHEAVSSSWKFGRIDVEKSRGQCSSYVAGYLNGSCRLPRVFKARKTQPFASHSQFLGEKILRYEKEKVYQMPVEDFISRSICFDGTNTNFSLWRSLKTAYYPRCPKFAMRTHAQRMYSYRTNEQASEICRETSPYRRAKEIVLNIITNYHEYCKYPVASYFARQYAINPYMGLTARLKAERQVYMELRTSELFLSFVCNSNNAVEQDTKLRMIEHFYSSCQLLGLKQQLHDINEFIHYDGFDEDDLLFFYDNKYFDEDKFKDMKLYRQFREQQLSRANESVKHKTLNDKNRIFEKI